MIPTGRIRGSGDCGCSIGITPNKRASEIKYHSNSVSEHGIRPINVQINALSLPPDIIDDLPGIIRDVPDIIDDLPDIIRDVPDIIDDLPDIIRDVSDIIDDLPAIIRDVPDIIDDLQDIIRDIPNIIGNVPDGTHLA